MFLMTTALCAKKKKKMLAGDMEEVDLLKS